MRICHQRSMTSLFEVQHAQIHRYDFMGILGKEWRVDGAAKKREYTGKYQLVLLSIHPDIERESALITQSENEREPRMIYFPDHVILTDKPR